MDSASETVTLNLDNGTKMVFKGRQFAGGSWFDEETGTLTRQNLYVTSVNEHVYAITERQGNIRHHRAYRVGMREDVCTISDGRQEMTVPLDLLLIAVQGLAGLDASAADALGTVEETLRAASC